MTNCLQEAVGSGAAVGLKSLQLTVPALAGAHCALNLGSFNSSVCKNGLTPGASDPTSS